MAAEKPSREDIDRKIEDLEQRLEASVHKLEAQANKLGKKLEAKAEHIGEEFKSRSEAGSALFWGVIAIVIGAIWLGNNLHWFHFRLPWLPVILIAAGVYMILMSGQHGKRSPNRNSQTEEVRDE